MPTDSRSRALVVPRELAGRPLDGALRALMSISWGDARSLIARGKVAVAGTVVTDIRHPVREGEEVLVTPNAPKPGRSRALEKSALVYVDPQLVVVNKPPGVSTVPYEPGERGTLDQLVAATLPRTKGPPSSLGVVQRLDRETSGLIVFARTFAAKKILAHQLRLHTVLRVYWAIVHGDFARPETMRSHLVKNRGDGLRGSTRFGNEGQLAVTHVQPLEALRGATLVACRLETGRTHQIRIHLSEALHPIVGERVYVRRYEGAIISAPRPMLHAKELGFTHPTTGHPMRFTIEPPEDFRTLLERLGGGKTARS